MSRATADLTLIQVFFFSVPMLVANLTLLIVALVVMFVLSPILSLVIVVFVPVFAWLAYPVPQPHLPGQLERPAPVGRGGRRRRRGRDRRARREGVRPGGPRVRPPDGPLARAVPIPDAHGTVQRPLLVDAAGAPDARPARRARHRRMAGARRAHHPRRVPRLRQLPGADHHAGADPVRRAGHCAAGARRSRASLRAARHCNRASPTSPTLGRSSIRRARSSSTTSRSATPTRRRRCTTSR